MQQIRSESKRTLALISAGIGTLIFLVGTGFIRPGSSMNIGLSFAIYDPMGHRLL